MDHKFTEQLGQWLNSPDNERDYSVGALFTFGAEPPKENNIIVYDDFVTTGTTMISMRNLLLSLKKNLFFLLDFQ